MKLSTSQKIKYRVSSQIIGVGVLLGIIYVMFSNGFSELYPYINGILAGLLIGILISYLELWVFTGGIRKLRFITLLAIRMVLYLILILLILTNIVIVSRMFRLDQSYFEVFQSAEFQHYLFEGNFGVGVLYAMFFAFSINFTRMMSRKMGQGVLVSFITGTFYRPVLQERLVMFVGLKNSPDFSRQLDGFTFFRFINEYFYDITEPIIEHEGIIYEYVEDVIVITWRPEKGLRNANCIQAYFKIRKRVAEKEAKYLWKYGLVPHPIASIHQGDLVRSEIGSIKTQIVFSGDVMNTTARLLSKAIELDKQLLISKEVLKSEALSIPDDLEVQLLGEISLRGKEHPLNAFSVIEKQNIAV